MKKFRCKGNVILAESKEDATAIFKKMNQIIKDIDDKMSRECSVGYNAKADYKGKGILAKFIRVYEIDNLAKATFRFEGSVSNIRGTLFVSASVVIKVDNVVIWEKKYSDFKSEINLLNDVNDKFIPFASGFNKLGV